MPYVAPTTVTPGAPIASALHNILAADIVDHESRIVPATAALASVPYAGLASNVKNYTIVSVTASRDLTSADTENKILISSSASDYVLTVPGSGFLAGQTINLARTSTGALSVVGASGVTINGSSATRSLGSAYSYAQLICLGKNFILVGAYV
jgi:hypothetical protein